MEFQIVEKGVPFAIKDKSTGQAITSLYVGAGWDMDGSKAVDLDLVAACLVDGKLTAQTRLVYFNDKTEPGVTLGADNRTGEGEGDDENIVFDLSKVEPDVNEIAIGLVAYSGADLSSAKNVHFRGCNGPDGTAPQVFDVPMTNAQAGDTVLYAARLRRGPDGWTVENVGTFTKAGAGTAAVQGFANQFTGERAAA